MAERIRVAIDARRLQDRPLGGVGRSLAGIVDRLAGEVDVVLLTDARRRPAPSPLRQVALRVPPRLPEPVWLQTAVVSWLRSFDGLFHGTYNALPFRLPVPGVVTIHDLSFEVHPEDFTRLKRRSFQIQARHSARVARRIITVSDFSKGQLIEHYRVPAARILVAPNDVDPRFRPENAKDADRVCTRLGIPPPYIAAMGGAPRRGLGVAVAAHRRLREGGVDVALVVTGPERPDPGPGVVHAGKLDDDDWAAVLAGAAAFCYPTRYEGFGIPALESIASGTPVVCAPVASLPEVLGDAAEWCDAPTVDALTAGLRRLLDDPAHAEDLRVRGLERVARLPDWDDAAEVTLRAYREALGP
jgi:glycosyltransferase involved in cell wall biosynthesis